MLRVAQRNEKYHAITLFALISLIRVQTISAQENVFPNAKRIYFFCNFSFPAANLAISPIILISSITPFPLIAGVQTIFGGEGGGVTKDNKYTGTIYVFLFKILNNPTLRASLLSECIGKVLCTFN
ncbi:MAG TPA: hypothetical protein VI757_01195 [Bacteroidia bacterium]|nr:hypothetical protein [Bacteroidia bacterium]